MKVKVVVVMPQPDVCMNPRPWGVPPPMVFIEMCIQDDGGQAGTIKLALEPNIGERTTSGHNQAPWIIEYASVLLNASACWVVDHDLRQCMPRQITPPLVDFEVFNSPAQSLSANTSK